MEFKPPIIANIPFEADQRRKNEETIVSDNLLLTIISSRYTLKKEIMAFGKKSLVVAAIKVNLGANCFINERNSIMSGIIDKNIKNAVCPEYAPTRLAESFLVKYRKFFMVL